MNVVLNLENVSKKFSLHLQEKTLFNLAKSIFLAEKNKREFWALKKITFSISNGEKIALLGKNGSGKTTLLRIISGILNPCSGTVTANFPFIPILSYTSGTYTNLPVIDNIQTIGAFLGIPEAEMKSLTSEILAFAELSEFAHVPVRFLSSGQKQRLAFAIFIHNKNDFWAFDESTSMADLGFRNKASRYFKKTMNSDKTIIMATHQLEFAQQHCQRAIWLDHGEIKAYGEITEVVEAYKKHFQNH
jgi:ABC-2 type transport system ATP-binding protein